MKIILPKYSFFDEDYLVTISFENVSDKPIYNIEHKINGVVQSKQINKYKNGVLVKEGDNDEIFSEDFENTTISTGQLDPGEKIVATVAIKDIWKSIAEEKMDNSKIALDCVSLLTCIKTNPVLFGIGAVAKAANSILNCFVVTHALECVDVATLPGSTVAIPYEVEVVDISDAMKDKATPHNCKVVKNVV